jgi:hypothetical protein
MFTKNFREYETSFESDYYKTWTSSRLIDYK